MTIDSLVPPMARSSPRLLVIEDEVPISLMMQSMLEELGYQVAGVAYTAAEALAIIESAESLSAATVDVDLNGETCEPVVAALNQRGVPFIVVTAYAGQALPDCVKGRSVLGKPFTAKDLQGAFAALPLTPASSPDRA
jgi:CheY-like chemotaxis protein